MNKRVKNWLDDIIKLCNQFGGFILSFRELVCYADDQIEIEQVLGYFRRVTGLSVTAKGTFLPKPLENFDVVINITKVKK